MRGETSRRLVPLCAGLAIPFLTFSCSHGGDDGGSGLRITLDFAPPSAGISGVVWIAEGGRAGEVLQVDVVARDIASEFDRFDLEIPFDPLVARAVSVSSGGVLDACAAVPVLKADNVGNGNANLTGSLVISEVISGPAPPGCTVSGEATLTRVTFRAAGRGTTALGFTPFDGVSGSRLSRTSPPVPAVPVQFFDSGAVIDVRR